MGYDKIILISLDTLRSDCLAYNQDKLYDKEYNIQVSLKKAKIDEMCSRGCFFSNAITAAPYTSASHAAYFTGLWPKNNKLFDQFNSKLKAENVFQIFNKSGYRTTFKTDFPFILGKYLNMIQGVDDYTIEEEKSALQILKNEKKVLSFFHFGQIHYPYGFHSIGFSGDDYRNKVKDLKLKYGIATDKIGLEDMAVETFRDKEDLDFLYQYKKIIAHLYKSKLDDDLFNLYLEGINYFHKNKFDTFLDELLVALGGEKYLIVIFADHGEAWNEETYGHHNSLDEGVIRVPILFYASDIKSQYIKNRIRTIDLLPTLLEMAGISHDNLDGQSLTKMIYDHRQEADRDAFSAVWVNKSTDVVQNMKDLKNNDNIETKDIAMKYSAAYYKGKYKYTENYKIFKDRSEKIDDFDRRQLVLFEDLQNKKEVIDKEIASQLSQKITKLNNIIQAGEKLSKSEQLKKYFHLQGYNV